MQNLLKALGNPHKGLPVVQIVGTKGKGSVATMLSAMLQYAGYKVGTYTRCEAQGSVGRLLSGCPTSNSVQSSKAENSDDSFPVQPTPDRPQGADRCQ
jgi:hypothetical protein